MLLAAPLGGPGGQYGPQRDLIGRECHHALHVNVGVCAAFLSENQTVGRFGDLDFGTSVLRRLLVSHGFNRLAHDLHLHFVLACIAVAGELRHIAGKVQDQLQIGRAAPDQRSAERARLVLIGVFALDLPFPDFGGPLDPMLVEDEFGRARAMFAGACQRDVDIIGVKALPTFHPLELAGSSLRESGGREREGAHQCRDGAAPMRFEARHAHDVDSLPTRWAAHDVAGSASNIQSSSESVNFQRSSAAWSATAAGAGKQEARDL